MSGRENEQPNKPESDDPKVVPSVPNEEPEKVYPHQNDELTAS